MTKKQREELAKKVEKILRKEWGDSFTNDNMIKIYDYCMDEATTNNPDVVAMECELKFG
jgi:hypothetical protein